MKIFDIIGVVVVAIWLGIAGTYIYHAETSSSADSRHESQKFVMDAGETWLVLRRQDRDAGYIHQSRTRLADGWLFEYDMYVALEFLGNIQVVEASVKSRLDADGYLEKFTTTASAAGEKLWAEGRVDGSTLKTVRKMGGKVRDETFALEQRPRLSASVFHALLAEPRLQPGVSYADSYFDPLALEGTEVAMRYVGKDMVEVYDEHLPSEHFIQVAPWGSVDVYTDARGEILLRGFPLKIIGARVPAALGRTRSASIQRRVEARQQKLADDAAAGSGGSVAFNLEQALRMLSGQTPAGPDARPDVENSP